MMNYKHLISIVALLHVALASSAQEIIPTPRHDEIYHKTLYIDNTSTIGYIGSELQPAADYLAQYMGLHITIAPLADIRLIMDDTLHNEEYQLVIGEYGVTIRGGGYGGVFNGITTFMQLLPSDIYTASLSYPIAIHHRRIKDAPRFEYRGFMLDVCRTWMDRESVKKFIDLLAYHKINHLRLHLTDDEAWRIEIKSHPELAEIGGFRGGDSPIKPRYGKWNKRWGGYYTQEDIRDMVAYAAQRNIVIIPEIDLPGHSLCMATIHPEILCDYTPTCDAAFGYDTRSAFCPTNEDNYLLLADIIEEICSLFPSKYIHIGGDEVELSQWRKCHSCQKFMADNGMNDAAQLQSHFMNRIINMVKSHGKIPAVWNEAIDGGNLSPNTLVYGWESIAECRRAAAEGYSTILVPGQYFYLDMKQSAREPGHDWAAIFDWSKVYGFSPEALGFSDAEMKNIRGFEATFFSEAYASRTPESPNYLHYQIFPRIVAFAQVAWIESIERNEKSFYTKLVSHYSRLDAMGISYRLMPPVANYDNGELTASTDDGSELYYHYAMDDTEYKYEGPIATFKPETIAFVSRRGEAYSPEAAVEKYFKTLTPAFTITSSMSDTERFSFVKAQQYGRLARTSRAGDVGDWIMFTFASPVTCRSMKVATGNFQLPRYIFENGYVEVSYDGTTFERIGDLDGGSYTIVHPPKPIKAVRMICTSQGNGAEWVSIQPPTIYPIL